MILLLNDYYFNHSKGGITVKKEFTCYCGLYCEACAIKVKVFPAARVLYDEMMKTGFENVVSNLPGGDVFWQFLKDIAENWVCVSCREGSGMPDCKVRECAKGKGVSMCALCESYPCGVFLDFAAGYEELKKDNEMLREKGWAAWAAMMDAREAEMKKLSCIDF